MPRICKYSNAQIIENMSAIAQDLRHTPTYTEYFKHPMHICGIDTIKKQFGGYLSLVKAANLEHSYYTEQEILTNLRTVYDDLGHVPTMKEYAKHPLRVIHPNRIAQRFGTWLTMCKKAGIPMMIQNMQYRQMSLYLDDKNEKETMFRSELLKELYNTLLLHPGISILDAIKNYTHASKSMYYKYFGNISTLRKCLMNEYGLNTRKRYQKRIRWTQSIIEEEFKRIELLIGRRPSHMDILKYTVYKNISHGIEEIYGTYNKLIAEMGYDPCCKKWTREKKRERRKQYIAALQDCVRKERTENWTLQNFYNACHITKKRLRPIFPNSKDWFRAANVPIPKSLTSYSKKK